MFLILRNFRYFDNNRICFILVIITFNCYHEQELVKNIQESLDKLLCNCCK